MMKSGLNTRMREPEKTDLEEQLEETKKQLSESIEHQRTKDEHLSVKEQQLRDKDQEMSALQRTNSELSAEADRLAAKIEELSIEYKAEKSGYYGRITELECQKIQLIADLEKESKHQEEVCLLRHELEMKDQQIEFDKERSELKDKYHELELKLKDASSPNPGKCNQVCYI